VSAREILHGHDRHQLQRARCRFRQHAGRFGAVPRRGDDRLDRKRCRRAQDRPDIMRIGDLVEHQHDALKRQSIDIRRGQGIGLGQQALMHGIRTEPLVDQARPHDFRGHAGVDMVVGEPPRGIFGEPQFTNPALRIGQRRCHRVPAIQHGRPVGGRIAVAPGRPAAGFTALVRAFAAAALKWRFSIAIAHHRLVSRVPDNGNLGPKGAPIG